MKNSGQAALLLCAAIIFYLVIDRVASTNSKKIGVVQMEKLVYDYKGMKDATQRYSLKTKSWNARTDSLETKLSDLYHQIRLDSIRKDNKRLESDIRTFVLCRDSYAGFIEKMKSEAEQEDKELTVGVINQINAYIKAYAIEKGYDVVLCNSQVQTVGHAKDQIDITQEVLDYANKKYEGLN